MWRIVIGVLIVIASFFASGLGFGTRLLVLLVGLLLVASKLPFRVSKSVHSTEQIHDAAVFLEFVKSVRKPHLWSENGVYFLTYEDEDGKSITLHVEPKSMQSIHLLMDNGKITEETKVGAYIRYKLDF